MADGVVCADDGRHSRGNSRRSLRHERQTSTTQLATFGNYALRHRVTYPPSPSHGSTLISPLILTPQIVSNALQSPSYTPLPQTAAILLRGPLALLQATSVLVPLALLQATSHASYYYNSLNICINIHIMLRSTMRTQSTITKKHMAMAEWCIISNRIYKATVMNQDFKYTMIQHWHRRI